LVGSMAFAAPSFGIWGRTVFMLAGQSGSDTTIYSGWGPNWMGSGQRMGMHATFTNDKIEFKITFYINQNTVDPSNLFGTVKLIPDMLSILVGRFDADGWDDFRQTGPNPNSDLSNDNVGRVNGHAIILVVAPKDSGIEVAGHWKTPAPSAIYDGWNWWPEYEFMNQVNNLGIAASYKIPDMLKIAAGFQQIAGKAANVGVQGEANIWARVHLLMVEGLTLWVDGRFYGFENSVVDMKFCLGAGYKMDAFGVYLGALLAVANTGTIGLDTNLEVVYDLGDLSLGLIALFSDGDLSATGMTIGVRPYVNLDDFGMRVAVEIRIDSGATTDLTWEIPVYWTFSIW